MSAKASIKRKTKYDFYYEEIRTNPQIQSQLKNLVGKKLKDKLHELYPSLIFTNHFIRTVTNIIKESTSKNENTNNIAITSDIDIPEPITISAHEENTFENIYPTNETISDNLNTSHFNYKDLNRNSTFPLEERESLLATITSLREQISILENEINKLSNKNIILLAPNYIESIFSTINNKNFNIDINEVLLKKLVAYISSNSPFDLNYIYNNLLNPYKFYIEIFLIDYLTNKGVSIIDTCP